MEIKADVDNSFAAFELPYYMQVYCQSSFVWNA